jgi:transposase
MLDETTTSATMTPPIQPSTEAGMVGQERWEEIRRMFLEDRTAIAEIARRLQMDRKTVRRCLSQKQWQPYRRPPKEETLLAAHADYLRERASHVQYSAQILFQELRRQRGYTGSYETVKRFVAPLRELQIAAAATQTRFETAPGEQSQIDWGQASVGFRNGRRKVHFFVLTLGYSRRGFYWPAADERLAQFLEAHERAFEHFGGHTHEHLYDRPRTVCYPNDEGRVVWNATFKTFAEYWGFDARLCRAYRAQTKGKVESGVKYLKYNFLPGREFVDIVDLTEQLSEWNLTIADVRIHGTTHERPIDRFAAERPHLVTTSGQPSFAHEGRRSRIVASDYLVSFQTNHYSVPFQLIGQTVEVQACQGQLLIYHHGRTVPEHPVLTGQHQLRILPEHGPGAIARNTRHRYGLAGKTADPQLLTDEVQVRDLSLYEQLAAAPTAAEVIP